MHSHSMPTIGHARQHALDGLRLLALMFMAGAAMAQTSPAFGPVGASPSAPADDIPLADYLGLLRQIAPAAEAGARDYLAARQWHCGQQPSTAELRQAMAGDGGDSVLMGLIRAAQSGDQAARRQLVRQMRCPAGASR